MSGDEKKSFLLRVDPALLAALEKWAADELRSVNGQVEWVLREAVRRRFGAKFFDQPSNREGQGGREGRKK